MNGKRSKWLRKMTTSFNPVLLTLIRNKYGEKTKEMDQNQLYKTAKKLWKSGELKEIKGWPTINKLRNLK